MVLCLEWDPMKNLPFDVYVSIDITIVPTVFILSCLGETASQRTYWYFVVFNLLAPSSVMFLEPYM